MTYLYTFIMNYLNGTYITQVVAKNHIEATRIWVENLSSYKIKAFTQKDKELALKDSTLLNPDFYVGSTNIWFTDMLTKKGHAIINLIKTER